MIVKIHKSPSGKVLAVCDSDIKGRVFEKSGLQLDLSSMFYDGKKMNEQELLKILPSCYIVNAVGKKSVGFLASTGFASKSAVKKIAGVPYVQCVIER